LPALPENGHFDSVAMVLSLMVVRIRRVCIA
jgi:hypothetical protein